MVKWCFALQQHIVHIACIIVFCFTGTHRAYCLHNGVLLFSKTSLLVYLVVSRLFFICHLLLPFASSTDAHT